MEGDILKLAVSDGLYAVLFVFLLFWVLRENAKRENNYQNIIDSLSKSFGSIDDSIKAIKSDVDWIKVKVDK